MQELAGKVAIVTGAAQGPGLAIARHLAGAGARVMLTDRHEAALTQAIDGLREGADLRSFAGDVAERLDMANLISATIDQFDRIDILVTAHGQAQAAPPLNPDDDLLMRMLRVNVGAGLRLSQMVAQRMIEQDEAAGGDADPARSIGAIVHLSTLAARFAAPDLLAYSVAQAAQEQATRGLAVALAPHRIRVNGVAMGCVNSTALQAVSKADPDLRDRLIAATPQRRIGGGRELASVVGFLVGPGAGFVTGQILTVDGGRSLIDPAGLPAL
ncbi:SDR family NAD(P)-dependent oxidoreductase [Paracoccus sp. p4-l81]|uniref:SDR family NAD(P)-dependent oxidoreductase n=1 Tax=unclassified Paracoccus (in: a-proteobacteria) TaxID=2688777 RepID=UPI0035B86AD6